MFNRCNKVQNRMVGEAMTMALEFFKETPLYRFLYRLSIRNRLILYFILSVLVPVSIISVTIYIKSSNIITSKIDQLIEKNLNIAETSFLQKFETTDDIAILISFNEKLMAVFAKNKPQTPVGIIGEMTTINGILEGYYLSNLFTKTTLFPKIYLLDRPEYKGYKFSDKVFDISEIQDERWYKEFSSGVFKVVGFNKTNTLLNTMDSIKVARKLYAIQPSGTRYSAMLTIDIETNFFTDILESIKASPNSQVFIVDDRGSVILSTKNPAFRHEAAKGLINRFRNKAVSSYGSRITKLHGVRMLVSVKKIAPIHWQIVSVSPVRELNQELNSFNKLVLLVIIISAVLSLLIALLLANDIVKPIQRLVRSMSGVKDGNFAINLSYQRNDEFAFLIQQYKTMLSEIKELIDKLYVSELTKQKAEVKAREYELKALQAQINPHFLYNTLDSINWLAIKYKAEDISTMVKSLSNFFRYSLNKGKTEISLEDEKKQIESYLMIQRIRFQEKLDFTVDFAPEILPARTIKLILQPIVENAILHGIEKRKGEGFIAIRGCRVGENIEIEISDNGAGANIQELNERLEDETDTETSFGIKNVHDRIKQFFGDSYGMEYHQNQSGGVTAVIRIPFKRTASF